MHKKNNVGPIKENFAAFYLGLGPIQKTKSKVQIKKKNGIAQRKSCRNLPKIDLISKTICSVFK